MRQSVLARLRTGATVLCFAALAALPAATLAPATAWAGGGACCTASGTPLSCFEPGSQLDCQVAGGIYQGDSTICQEVTCTCGNGDTEGGEECDDANSTNGDDCDNNCTDTGCGNFIVTAGEQCDDGNTQSGDGCSEVCEDEAVCGNESTEAGVECDDGGTQNGDGCDEFCQLEPLCGDEVTESPEECDDGGVQPGDGCSEICEIEFCGDGTNNNNGAEQCDDGNNTPGDGCNEDCETEFCGDGTVNNSPILGDNRIQIPTGEECDDGNTGSGDGCNELCEDEFCGDGIVNDDNGETSEQCDDGNLDDNDGCSSTCTSEFGACCDGSACHDNVSEADCAGEFEGSYGGDGTTCNDPGICVNCGDSVVQIGEECDDGDTASGDGCDTGCAFEPCFACDNGPGPDFGPSVCVEDNNQPCDDGNDCSLGDQCSGGVCGGGPPIIPAACDWVMVAGSPTRPAQSRARGSGSVTGDICGQTTSIGDSVVVNGDIVATATSGKGSRFGSLVSVVGDIITGGASINGKPKGVLLPGLLTDVVPGGTATVQIGAPTRDLNTDGTSLQSIERVGECQDAIDSIVPSTAILDGNDLPMAAEFGKQHIKSGGNLDLDASGAVNVFDFERLTTGKNTTITLNGNSIPDVTFILRVDRKIFVRLGSSIVLTNGATPERVIIYGRDLCKFGRLVTGGGTVFCPAGKLKLDQNSVWDGSLISGRRRVDLRHQVTLTHVPLLVGAP
ncbi:MAG: DUF4215 domain-containing protein [Candidatus Binatia bacterium]